MRLDHFVLGASLVFALAAVALVVAWRASRAARREALVTRLRPDGARTLAPEPQPGGLGATLARTLRPLARIATPTNAEESSRLRLRLLRAGMRGDHALEAFVAAKLTLATAALGAFLWVNARLVEPVPNALLVAVIACAAGFYAPSLWLSSRISARRKGIERGLPDCLDLLVTCVEAGLGLDAALVRVAGETALAFPMLSEELELTFLEVKAGMPRADAFRRLAHRTGVEDLKQLAATLTQTELFGTSVGLALRVQAEGMRTRRMQRAEERAAMVAVKMTLPLVFFILPSLFAVIIGPALVNISERLFTT
ncbi:MAG TPA: type II secretion system F family protein [Anaeromyxobacter sp.]